jgi:hypothetical protein
MHILVSSLRVHILVEEQHAQSYMYVSMYLCMYPYIYIYIYIYVYMGLAAVAQAVGDAEYNAYAIEQLKSSYTSS